MSSPNQPNVARIGLHVTLLVAAAAVPFTALRLGMIGVGEILFAGAALSLIAGAGAKIYIGHRLRPLVYFWVVYLVAIVLGLSWNVLFLDHPSGTVPGAIFDLVAYAIILITLIVLSDDGAYTGIDPKLLFEQIFFAWSVVFIALYAVSLVSNSLFGLPLRYYGYFMPLVTNVHQAAMITSAMPFVVWHLAISSRSNLMRLFYIVAGILFVRMALESGATKALMGLVFGGAMSALFAALRVVTWRGGRAFKVGVFVAVAWGVAIVLLADASVIGQYAARFFYDNDGSGARAVIYRVGFDHFLESMFFGFGPGPHVSYSPGAFSDAHNTILTVLLQGGLLGLVIFVVALYGYTTRLSSKSFFLVGAVSAISMYALGGDILRRLPIWLAIAGIAYLSAPSTRRSAATTAHTVPDGGRQERSQRRSFGSVRQ